MERNGLEVLPEAESRWLLSQVAIGRVCVPLDGISLVVPVNFLCLDDDILFFSAEGAKLRAAEDHALVTFEADRFDEVARCGWSVVVTGNLEEVATPARIAAVTEAGLHPWAGGDRHHLLRIAPLSITGRRVGPAPPNVAPSFVPETNQSAKFAWGAEPMPPLDRDRSPAGPGWRSPGS